MTDLAIIQYYRGKKPHKSETLYFCVSACERETADGGKRLKTDPPI